VEAMQPESVEALQEYDGRGVDLTLIRRMQSMTPAERLAELQAFVDAVWKVRAARGEA